MVSLGDRQILQICRGEPAEAEATHYVSIDPRIQSGQACLNHSRLPCWCIAAFVKAGRPVEDILQNYPQIGRNDVLVAIWYLGLHGTRSEQKRWKAWAKQNHGDMWAGEWEKVSDPPAKR